MAVERAQLIGFLNRIGARPQDNLKMLLYYGDLSDDFNDDEDWGALCEFALEVDEKLGTSEEYASRYKDLLRRKEFEQALFAMDYDLKDNKIFAAMAIHRMDVPKHIPMVASAAYNKHAYAGLQDEFALTRFLHWSGFDINASTEPGGVTPLHLFSFTAPAPGTNARAVEWLLAHGADIDAVNANGDTALAYLCGSQSWSEAQSSSFTALLRAGSDPFAQAKDGSTPLSVMTQANEIDYSDERADIIAKLLAAQIAMEASDEEAPLAAPTEQTTDARSNVETAVDEDRKDGGAKGSAILETSDSIEQEKPAPLAGPAPTRLASASNQQDDEPESGVPSDIPLALMAAARAWREKGGNLGALGRWSFRRSEENPTPESR